MVEAAYTTPAYLFDTHSKAIIAASLKKLREASLDAHAKEIEQLEDFYEGGSDVVKYLYRNPAESEESFTARQKRFAHLNYVGRIVDELVDDVYGDEVQRSFGVDADPAADEALKTTLEFNNIIEVQQEVCRSQVLMGDGWINVSWREPDQMVGIFAVHPLDFWFRMDPGNPSRLLEIVERRRSDRPDLAKDDDGTACTYWIWNDTSFCEVDADGNYLTPATPNPYGTIPYVRWRGRSVVGGDDGLSFVRDAVSVQKLILNRVSDADKQIRYQAHGLLVIKGIDDPVIKSGADSFIRLSNPTDDAFFINPGADLKAVEDSTEGLVDRLFEISSVPASMVRGGTANSGLQLAIEMRPLTRIVGSVRTKAAAAEKRLITLIALIGRAHGQSVYPEVVDPVVEFSDNFLPSDEVQAFTRDMAMLSFVPVPLMTREDFLAKWHRKLRNNPAALAQYIDEIDAEAAPLRESVSSPPQSVVVTSNPAQPPVPVPGTKSPPAEQLPPL